MQAGGRDNGRPAVEVLPGRGRSRRHQPGGEALLVAQPSLSQAIAGFERELGMPLFHRVGRGWCSAKPGARSSGPPGWCCAISRKRKATMRALKGLRGGRVDLITMPSPGMEPLTTILTAFARAYPDVTVNAEAALHSRGSARTACAPASAEIGVLGSAEPTRAADLDVVPLESQALVLISGPDDDGPRTEDPFRARNSADAD